MRNVSRTLVMLLVMLVAMSGCKREKVEEDAFSFLVYPGAQYLLPLTDMTKQAHKVLNPNAVEAPPTAIYDSDASVATVAAFYAKSYGYGTVAAEAPNNQSAARSAAHFRTGDLQSDVQAIAPLLRKMNLNTDLTRAQGKYKAADIEPKPNRPRVTVQRPYFDVTKSQVVDRTLILMSR